RCSEVMFDTLVCADCISPPSSALALPAANMAAAAAKAHAKALAAKWFIILSLIRVDSFMGRHSLGHRLGLFVAKVGVDPKEQEEAEIDGKQQPSKMHLDARHVGR